MMYLIDPGERLIDERASGKPKAGLRTVSHASLVGKASAYVNLVSARVDGGSDGWLEAWSGGPQPPTSALNYRGGADDNMVLFVAVTPQGSFQIFTSTPTYVIVDLRGYGTSDHSVVVSE